jgi:nitrate reductase gamma subunit
VTLLEFARGPAFRASVAIMTAGIVWRLVGILLLRRRAQHAMPRVSVARRIAGGGSTMISRFIPRRTFWPRIAASVLLSTLFHVGLAIVLLGGAAHILLIEQVTGLRWANLPQGMVMIASGLTLSSLLIMLARRLMHPVLRLLSTADDYLSWLLVFLPVITGIFLAREILGSYETLLSLHILSAELMMIWLLFGKLMHGALVFPSRGAMGANFTRKGAAT